LDRVLDELVGRGVGGIVFGNIRLEDIRAWYDERLRARGLEHVEPLWGERPEALVEEFLARGFRARVVGVNLEIGCAEWLGRDLDERLIEQIAPAPGADVAGECGEYHTFVYDGPLFRAPVQFITGATFELDGHRLIDLVPAGMPE